MPCLCISIYGKYYENTSFSLKYSSVVLKFKCLKKKSKIKGNVPVPINAEYSLLPTAYPIYIRCR